MYTSVLYIVTTRVNESTRRAGLSVPCPGQVEGEPLFQDGEPLRYEIGPYSFGPTLYRWTTAYSLTEEELNEVNSVIYSEAVERTEEPGELPYKKGEIVGEESWSYPWGSIAIQYGRLIQ
jgi:hypothetical protein